MTIIFDKNESTKNIITGKPGIGFIATNPYYTGMIQSMKEHYSLEENRSDNVTDEHIREVAGKFMRCYFSESSVEKIIEENRGTDNPVMRTIIEKHDNNQILEDKHFSFANGIVLKPKAELRMDLKKHIEDHL